MTKLIVFSCLALQMACTEPTRTPTQLKDMPIDVGVDLTTDMPSDAPEDISDEVDQPLDLPVVLDMTVDQGRDTGKDLREIECGNGIVEQGEVCDDHNKDDFDFCSKTCQPTYPCKPLPVSCASAESSTTEHQLKTVTACSFGLKSWTSNAIANRRKLIDALVPLSAGRRTIDQVLGDLNRSGTKDITAQSADRLKNHDWTGFRWNAGDMAVSYWYPQGITGTSDADESGQRAGREAVLVSWYNKTDARPTKGVRISLADTTNLNQVKYRHLLLVEPTGSVGNPNFKAVLTGSGNALHAGGIVWFKDYLYVADTSGGLRVFDLASIFKVPNFDTTRVGVANNEFNAHGYGYAVPEVMRFTLDSESCPIKFSFVSLDRSSSPPALITGEYASDHPNGRLAVWSLDPKTGLMDVRQNHVRAVDAYIGGQTKMQGAARFEGNFYISSSSQYQQYGRLYRTKPGLAKSSISAWVYGAEDLYVNRRQKTIWTAAEFPDARDVVGIPIRTP